MNMDNNNSNNSNVDNKVSGVVYGNVGVGETTYEMNKFQAQQGHGFAAERAEHIHDLYQGKDAVIVGDTNLKDGADRIVNGTEIQSKYCRSGSACIHECFSNGKYRYYSKDGKPMQVEVPKDMYDDAVKSMRRRIANNEVEGISNPDDAEKLVKRGNYTYEQAKNIAQAGTIESLTFDAANGIIIANDAMGISATISFAMSIWNGEDFETAIENAALNGFKVGGVSFLTTIISSQIARTSIASSVRLGTDFLVSKLGSRATSYIANALRSGTNIYGAAAMNNVSKLVAGNIIASSVSLVVLSAADIVDAFRGRISGEQLIKNVSVTGAAIAGGNVGWVAGNAIGAVIGGTVGGAVTGGAGAVTGAKVGSKVGGFVGGVACGTVAGNATKGVMDNVIEDDSVKMMRIVEQEFVDLSERFVLTENEVYKCLSILKDKLTKDEIKNIHASKNRELYVQSLIMECINPIIAMRIHIDKINADDIMMGARLLMEDAIDGAGIFDESGFGEEIEELRKDFNIISDISDEQLIQSMVPVIKMNDTLKREENILRRMKRNNEETEQKLNKIIDERQALKKNLEDYMN